MADHEASPPNLDEIERRCESATAGPWKSFVEGRDHFGGDDFIRTGGIDDISPDMYVSLSEAGGTVHAGPNDLDFIANARQDVPDLVAALRRSQAERPPVDDRGGSESERDLIDANVDFGSISGYFVRLDVEIPAQGRWEHPSPGPASGYLILTPDEAENLSALLMERSAAARRAQVQVEERRRI